MIVWLGILIAAWIGALVGAVAMAVLSAERAEHRCRRHYEWDAAAWRFVPVHPGTNPGTNPGINPDDEPEPPTVARHAAPR